MSNTLVVNRKSKNLKRLWINLQRSVKYLKEKIEFSLPVTCLDKKLCLSFWTFLYFDICHLTSVKLLEPRLCFVHSSPTTSRREKRLYRGETIHDEKLVLTVSYNFHLDDLLSWLLADLRYKILRSKRVLNCKSSSRKNDLDCQAFCSTNFRCFSDQLLQWSVFLDVPSVVQFLDPVVLMIILTCFCSDRLCP